MEFKLGRLVATRTVASLMEKDAAFSKFTSASLERYTKCDWGDLDESDWAQNDEALKNEDNRLLAAYKFPTEIAPSGRDDKIWIITEWDHSVTTILFPSEY